MKFRQLFSAGSFVFLVPVAGALMVFNYGLFDYFLRSIGKEILFASIRVAIAGVERPGDIDLASLRAQVAVSDFVRPVRAARSYVYSLQANEVLLQRMGFLRYHFVFTAPESSRRLMVFEIFSSKLLWLFHGSTVFMWSLLVSLFWAIRRRARREEQIREEMVKEALEAWLQRGEFSTFVSQRFPRLVEWWDRRQAEFDRQARALHDIKVPLAALARGAEGALQANVSAIHSIIAKPCSVVDENFDVLDVIEAAAQSARAFDPRVRVNVCRKAPRAPFLRGSSGDFLRHLANLLTNSIEASLQPLSADLVVEIVVEECVSGLKVSVRDWGRGIPKSKLAQIGRRGFTFGKENGSGYGLHYCRKWIEKCGGSLQIHSEVERGTTVSLEFPWGLVSHDGAKVFHGMLSGSKVLLILEDDPIMRDLFKMAFAALGLREERLRWVADETELDTALRCADLEECSILCDYYIEGTQKSGPEILSARGLAHRALLLSHIVVDDDLREKLRGMGMPFWSKEFLLQSLRLGSENHQAQGRVSTNHEEDPPACAVR